jgi:ribose transport system substrate-binding protein
MRHMAGINCRSSVRTLVAGLMSCLAAICVAACGAGDALGNGSVSESWGPPTVSLDEVMRIVDGASGPVQRLEANGEPFDARPVAEGKTIGVIAGSTVIALFHQIMNPFTEAAATLGIDVKICDTQNYQAAQAIRCVQQFVNQKVDAIVLQSLDPKTLQGPLAEAKKSGILVIAQNTATENAPLVPNVDAQVSFPYIRAAQLEALSTVALSGGTAKTLVITSNEYVNSRPMQDAIEATLRQACGSRCSLVFRDVAIAEWNRRLPSVVQSAVRIDPSIDYIIPLFDGEVAQVSAGLRAANAADRVKVISFNGSQGVVDFLAQTDSALYADVGAWPAQLGWATADAAARLFAGERDSAALRDAKVAARIFDRDNVATLDLARPDSWYGDFDLAGFYKRQWMVP